MKLMKITGVALSAALVATLTVAMDSSPSELGGAPEVKGVVTGTLVFDGKQPEVKPLVISAEQAKGCCTLRFGRRQQFQRLFECGYSLAVFVIIHESISLIGEVDDSCINVCVKLHFQ